MRRLFLLLTLLPALSKAAELYFGQTFEITEASILDVIEGRLRDNKILAQIKAAFERNIKAYINEPRSKEFSHAISYKVEYFNPELVLKDDIIDSRGHLIAAAGTKINPLDNLSLNPHWLFINANYNQELSYAHKLEAAYPNLKVILVKGSYPRTQQGFSSQVYFDQDSKITEKLKIGETPALVSRADKLLKIELGEPDVK
jgi:conjugal transfer pilus assembly protein TraW